MNRWLGIALLVAVAGALALRMPELDRRPMHNDEAVNALKLQSLWERAAYRYDPDEYHGPALYYATLPFLWLSGAKSFAHVSETTLRLMPVCFGVTLILLLLLLADGLGRSAAVCAGVLTAISPAMTFYSRYFIHEMLLVCFTMLLLAAGWRYAKASRSRWAIIGGAALGLMYATKETFVLPLAAMAGAGLLTLLWTHWREPRALGLKSRWQCTHLLVGAAVAVVISVTLFTSCFTNPRGPLDSLGSYLPWLSRAGGASPHIHPWSFYLERLLWFHQGRGPVWTEALIVALAAVGFFAALRRDGLQEGSTTWVRFLGFYTLLLTAAYSAISYKTPWCLLGFLHGMLLLAGVGAAVLLRLRTWRGLQALLSALLAGGAGHLAWQAWQASFVYEADRRNPHVYAHTAPDLLELVEKVQALANVHPDHDRMLIKVSAPEGDYWPLPWYLRQFPQVGWWDKLPRDPYAPVTIVGAKFQAALDEKSDNTHVQAGIYSLRPRVFLELYVQFDLWQKYLQTKTRAPAQAAR